ncbi:MAG: glycosyltransferase family 4 protein [Candidatus Bathyarchaeia archaeon]
MKIAHIIHTFPPAVYGGGEAFAYQLSKKLAENGHEVHIVTRGFKGLAPSEKLDGVYVHRYPNPAPEKWKYHPIAKSKVPWYEKYLAIALDIPKSVKTIENIQKEFGLDILHASFIIPAGFSGVLAKKSTNLPLVITVHGNADFYEVPWVLHPILAYTLHKGDEVVAVGEELQENLMRRFDDLKVQVIPNGIEINKFAATALLREETRRRYNIGSEDPVVLSVCRLVERKNLDILLASAPQILKKLPTCKFLICGEGPEEAKLRKIAFELNLGSAVIFTGFVSEAEKIRLYAASDVFIQLSSREGLSISLLESKAAGIPAVVADFRGTREPVTDGESGIIIKGELSPAKVAETLLTVLQNRELLSRMGYNAKKEAEAKYSIETMAEKYVALYEKALSQRT